MNQPKDVVEKTQAIALNEPEIVENAPSFENALLKIVERSDIDPERLEKFLDLHAKTQARAASIAFFDALAGFQGDCPIIPRSRKVDFTAKSGNNTKYSYAPIDEIVHIIKPILVKWGLSFSFDIKKTASESENELQITVRHRGGHSEVTTYYYNPLHDDQRMNQSQRAKSSITYAKRAGLENALGIVTADEDDDANRALDTTVSDAQIDEIKQLVEQTKSEEKKLLAFLKVDSFDQLTSFEAKKAIHALKQKRSK
jgi:ERF superfamily